VHIPTSPKLTMAHLPTSCTRMPAERKGDRFQRLHIDIDQGSTEYEPHCRSQYNHMRCAELSPPQSVMTNCQSPQFCSQIQIRVSYRCQLLRRRAALLLRAHSAPPVPASAAGQNPARDRLEPKPNLPPSPFRRDLAQKNGVHPRGAPPRRELIQGFRVRGAYRGYCGWIECPNQLVAWGQPSTAAETTMAHLSTCIFLSHARLKAKHRSVGESSPPESIKDADDHVRGKGPDRDDPVYPRSHRQAAP
jgi:hypothetical protein